MAGGGFFSSKAYAVVGASADRSKFGNKVLRWYMDNGLAVIPINPKTSEIEGLKCSKSLTELKASIDDLSRVSVSVITPPGVSQSVIEEAAQLGIKNLWFQPGSEPTDFHSTAKSLGVSAIGGGACILVEGPSLLSQARL